MTEPEFMEIAAWDETFQLCAEVNEYCHGGGLAIQLYDKEEGGLEPFADLTVNLIGYLPGEHRAFVDTNNLPEAEELIRKYKLGEPTGRIGHSGYCSYPEYEFDMREVNRYCVNPESEKVEPKRARDDGR